jgi:hypothetical protein
VRDVGREVPANKRRARACVCGGGGGGGRAPPPPGSAQASTQAVRSGRVWPVR